MRPIVNLQVTQLHPQGGVVVSSMFRGRLISKTYYGYTKKEAKRLYFQEILSTSRSIQS